MKTYRLRATNAILAAIGYSFMTDSWGSQTGRCRFQMAGGRDVAPDKAHLLPSWRLNCGKALQDDGQQFGRTSISRTGSLMCFNCLPQ